MDAIIALRQNGCLDQHFRAVPLSAPSDPRQSPKLVFEQPIKVSLSLTHYLAQTPTSCALQDYIRALSDRLTPQLDAFERSHLDQAPTRHRAGEGYASRYMTRTPPSPHEIQQRNLIQYTKLRESLQRVDRRVMEVKLLVSPLFLREHIFILDLC